MNPIFFVFFSIQDVTDTLNLGRVRTCGGYPPNGDFMTFLGLIDVWGYRIFRHHSDTTWSDEGTRRWHPRNSLLMAKSLCLNISPKMIWRWVKPLVYLQKVHWWMDGYSPNYGNCPSCRDPHLPCCSSSASASGFSSSSAAATWNLRKQTVGDRFQKAETGGTHGVANCEELMVIIVI